jgi:hypothetical protein
MAALPTLNSAAIPCENCILVYNERTEVCTNRKLGRGVAQAVSRRFPTSALQVKSCGICGGLSGMGADFLRVLRYLLPIPFPPIAPHS